MQEVMQPVQEATLTTGGWVTMILSLVLVWGGVFWCFKKVLSSPTEEKAPPGFGP
jgi:hypothetical protein